MSNNKVFKSAFLVTSMMLVFKIIGFIKQAIIAFYFGANAETDIYFIAFGFITGVATAIAKSIGVAIIGVYSFKVVNEGRDAANRMVSALIEITFPAMFLITACVCIAAPLLTNILAPSYDGEIAEDLTFYLRILSGVFIFTTIEIVCGALLDAEKSFFVPRLQSIIYSVAVICACIFISDVLEVTSLILAQYTSSIIYTVLLILACRRFCRIKLINPFEEKGLIQIGKVSIPLIIGNSVLQINAIVDRIIASGLEAGAVSSLSYCHTLEDFVTNIVIVNIGNVIFAHFATYVAEQNIDEIAALLKKTLSILVVFLVPISVVTITCSVEIVEIVYFRGNFEWSNVLLTGRALAGYAFAFPFVAIRDILGKSIYAYSDTVRPMRNSIVCIILNILCSIILSKYLGILGIAVGTVISVIVGCGLNVKSFNQHLPTFKYGFLVKILVSNLVFACFEVKALIDIKNILSGSNAFIIFVSCTLLCFGIHTLLLFLQKKIVGILNDSQGRKND